VKDHDSSVEQADVQTSAGGVQAHATRLFDGGPVDDVAHVGQVGVEQDDPVVVAVERQCVAEYVDCYALRRVQPISAGTIRRTERTNYLNDKKR